MTDKNKEEETATPKESEKKIGIPRRTHTKRKYRRRETGLIKKKTKTKTKTPQGTTHTELHTISENNIDICLELRTIHRQQIAYSIKKTRQV
jgi:hypothetical protein